MTELDPSESLELDALRSQMDRIVRPEDTNRAEQIVRTFGNNAFSGWLAPRLVVDERGNKMFNPDTESGRKAWEALDRLSKDEVRSAMWSALILIETAKNSQAGQK